MAVIFELGVKALIKARSRHSKYLPGFANQAHRDGRQAAMRARNLSSQPL